jgi:hypothetical protein
MLTQQPVGAVASVFLGGEWVGQAQPVFIRS